jgi:nucleoside-diphosphate-sugar epimerase
MRIIVTGHLGFIGTALTPLLTEAGHDVLGIDTGLFRHCDFGEKPKPIQGWKRIYAI